jgi:hypothetical protein
MKWLGVVAIPIRMRQIYDWFYPVAIALAVGPFFKRPAGILKIDSAMKWTRPTEKF